MDSVVNVLSPSLIQSEGKIDYAIPDFLDNYDQFIKEGLKDVLVKVKIFCILNELFSDLFPNTFNKGFFHLF